MCDCGSITQIFRFRASISHYMTHLIIVKNTKLVLNQHRWIHFTNIPQGNIVRNVVYASHADVYNQTAETSLKDQSA